MTLSLNIIEFRLVYMFRSLLGPIGTQSLQRMAFQDHFKIIHQENHFYPGTNMFVSFFPGFHKASQDVLGQPELS
jgi:hypothetical protein